jgi:hypothetical protein
MVKLHDFLKLNDEDTIVMIKINKSIIFQGQINELDFTEIENLDSSFVKSFSYEPQIIDLETCFVNVVISLDSKIGIKL